MVPKVKGKAMGGAHDRFGVTGDHDRLDDMESPAPRWATVGVDGYGGIGTGGVPVTTGGIGMPWKAKQACE